MPRGDSERALEGRNALVTGSTGGLGAAICERLALDGARLILTDIDPGACERLSVALPGGPHVPVPLDVREEAAWEHATATSDGLGGLHVLVNNAGVGALGTVESEKRHRFDNIVAVDQVGVWLGMKHAGPVIERSGGGSIVNICSVLGTVGGFGDGVAYAAAKGAVRTMTKNAALHWARRGVRVNSVHPSYVETEELVHHYGDPDRYRRMVDDTPMGRLGRPAEVAGAVAFLAGDDSTYVTGSELYVDGGWTAR